MPLRKGMRFGLPIRNRCFVGREQHLRQLQRFLVHNAVTPSGSENATSCILHSQSGLGKTEIAVEFAYRNRHSFDCVVFLKCSTESGLSEEFQSLAEYLGIRATGSTIVERIKELFEQSKLRWLLILDDVDFELDSLLTRGEFGSIIVTTRKDTMCELGHAITVEPLSEKKGAALMHRYFEQAHHGRLSPLFKDQELREISRKFGNHPPSLLKVVNASIDYESSHRILQDLDGRDEIASVVRKTSTKAKVNFTDLPRTSLNLLLVVSFLDGDFISDDLLLSSRGIPIDIGCADPFRMRETIKFLRRKGLICRLRGGISIDRDLQIDILCWLDIFTALRDAVFSSACHLVRSMIPSADALQNLVSCDSNNVVRGAIPHALRLYENLHQTPGNKVASSALALTFSKASQDSWVRTSSMEGNIILKAALALVQSFQSQKGTRNGIPNHFTHFDSHGRIEDSRDTAAALETDICGFLGAVSSKNGLEERQRSMTYRGSALQVRLRYTNMTDPTFSATRDTDLILQNAYSDLSFGLLCQGDFSEADRVIEMCRSHFEGWDPNRSDLPFQYAKYYLVKSFTFMASGESGRALQFCQRAIDFLRQGHHDTWLFSHYQFAQATMYFYAGQAMKALELHEAILAERSSYSLPEDDIRYVESVYMVAALSYFTGAYERSQNLCESILEYGLENHPEECARLQYMLSQAYFKLGMIDDARIMSDRAHRFRIQRISLVPDEIPRAEEPLAMHDHFCSVYTRLTSKLKSLSVGRVVSIF
ncbi:uncharacterized protein GGS22DRAFT_183498 [Annulohypoxylon maeteangense]|uniref:uncharacterized protein n=1 Tax=Annulohypoxylon maeteangense TaxID=1927788 RepID=UPI002007F41E|nr:uncharacterized protein GGS22DRAFT_183498 [Annulohypoxylon maeteangense]KAI0890151.1 hypothetical protein GGS22DRAFT_183498 [Annulohypoxylon maeteangense]